jgi:uncharacterized protein involved in outer membrane biogenesis
MAASKTRRVMLWAVGIVAVLVLAAFGGWLFVAHEMKERVIEALGPLGSAEDIDVSWGQLTLTHVRLRGPQGWPTDDALRAERVTLDIDMHSLLNSPLHVRSVAVDGFYLSVARFADGEVNLLPNLKESAGEASASTSEAVTHAREGRLIDRVWFERGTMEFFDQAVRQPPYRILVTNAHATVDHLVLPGLADTSNLDMSGSIKGPSHTGTVAFNGWMKIANKDSQTHTTLRNVDIATLDPYLLQKAGAKTTVTGGTIDLTLDATVRDYRIHAPGTVVINHLQLSENGNPLDTFLSIPTKAAVAALKNHQGQIKVDFQLDGDLHDPKFSLNESLSKKIAAGFAKVLGVSAEGVAQGAGDTVKGIAGALKNLLSK